MESSIIFTITLLCFYYFYFHVFICKWLRILYLIDDSLKRNDFDLLETVFPTNQILNVVIASLTNGQETQVMA